MQPNKYTELFFLDEATALAAGHRPCAECRNAAFKEYKAAWIQGNADGASEESLSAAALDRTLHEHRLDRKGEPVTYTTAFQRLPEGVMFLQDGKPHLKWNGRAFHWSARGYTASILGVPLESVVRVLTPRGTVGALAAGYQPQVHESAST